MKNFISVLFLLAFASHLWGQVGCSKLQFSYDNAGNRVKRNITTCFTGGGNDETAALKVASPTNNSAANTKSLLTTLSAYPNPNKGVFQVKIDNPQENGVLELYDFMGRKIHSQDGSTTSVFVNVPNLVIGTYMLVYRTPEKIVGKSKFVIE